MRSLRYLAVALMIALFAVPTTAQRHDEPPFYDSAHPTRLLEFKPHVAIGLSSLLQNYGAVIPGLSDMQLSPGIMLRAGIDVRIALRNSFALGTGISFDSNHSKYALSIVDNVTGSINSIYMRNSYREVHVPFYLSWRLNLGRRMRWNIDLGSYYAFASGGHMRASGYTSGQNSLGQPVITHITYKTKYFEANQSIINGVKTHDYGPHIATGLTYRHAYSINLIFEMSVPNLAINHNVIDAKYRNINAAIELGYNF